MSKFQKVCTAALVSLFFGSAGAGPNDIAPGAMRLSSPIPAGCYLVKRGFIAEQSIDAAHVVGHYTFWLLPVADATSRGYLVSGPLSGSEDGGEGARARKAASYLYRARVQEEEGPHGGHNLGTYNRVGTMTTEGDAIQVTSASCPDSNGNPLYIQGVESLSFVRGTGALSGLLNGRIDFNLTFDACTKQPQANLEVIQGQLCFQ